jgi:hypothetical protein
VIFSFAEHSRGAQIVALLIMTCGKRAITFFLVTTGLDPVVHAETPRSRRGGMDCRVKARQ